MEKLQKVTEKLLNYYGKSETFPNCCYLYGQKSVGKSLCVEMFLENTREFIESVIIYADECCYSNKILFECIVNKLNNHVQSEANNYESFAKIDTMEDFLNQITQLDVSKSYIIVIEKAERLRDMDMNIFAVLSKLQEFTGLNISCIFISHIAFEKMSGDEIIEIHMPDYSKNDITEILLSKYDKVHREITNKSEEKQLANELDEEFYKNYLNVFMNVFYKACRDLKELSFLAEKCYSSYYSPVLTGEIRSTDVTNLWRHVTKSLKMSLNTIYMRVGNDSNEISKETEQSNENGFEIRQRQQSSIKAFAQMLELPFYAKYLLIASFLASHNDAKCDKKLFMKHHGKERKRRQPPKVKIYF